ncbi:MAG TPA: hypothetical protein VGY56_05595 [Verrucomicrobiae bacterium]|nr:hypothetical protein [Verrucomicrobiae bacterium]
MKNVALFLPESTYHALSALANSTGIEVAHFCSNVLTDYVANNEPPPTLASPLRSERSSEIIKKPEIEISEMELIRDIILILKKNGGSEEKAIVEKLVYEKHVDEFTKPYWQEPVGGSVPRWQKNTQFARNSACKLGLLKRPEDAGRGIWALTDKGWKFE